MPEEKDKPQHGVQISVVAGSGTGTSIIKGTVNVVSSLGTAEQLFGALVLPGDLRMAKPPDDHPIYSLVGRVASEWAHLEHLLAVITWELADIDPKKGACITPQGYFARLSAVAALCRSLGLNTNTVTRAEAFKNKLNGLAEDRARIIHDPWYHYTSPDMIAQFKAMPKKEPVFGIQDVDQKKIEITIAEIKRRSNEIEQFRDYVKAELAALRDKSG